MYGNLIEEIVAAYPDSASEIEYGFDCFQQVYPIPVWEMVYDRAMANSRPQKLKAVPRIFINHAKQPIEILPSPRSFWICTCGLTKRAPLCDGSHTQLK
jgi:hypothetical protein